MKKPEEILKTDQREESTLLDESFTYNDKFTNMLKQFKSMLDGHLGSIKAGQYPIGLKKTDNRPVHSKSYRAGPKAKDSRNTE